MIDWKAEANRLLKDAQSIPQRWLRRLLLQHVLWIVYRHATLTDTRNEAERLYLLMDQARV